MIWSVFKFWFTEKNQFKNTISLIALYILISWESLGQELNLIPFLINQKSVS